MDQLGGLLGQLSGADNVAQDHAGDSGDKDLFSSVLGMLSGKEDTLKEEDVDEEDMVNSHKAFYGSGGTGGVASSGGIGKAAAMQAVKMFAQDQSGSSGSSASSGSGKIVGLAMGQAAKLFGKHETRFTWFASGTDGFVVGEDNQASNGNVGANETKQSAVHQAGQQALKMYLKSEMGGGGSSGGGGMMGMASKFLNK